MALAWPLLAAFLALSAGVVDGGVAPHGPAGPTAAQQAPVAAAEDVPLAAGGPAGHQAESRPRRTPNSEALILGVPPRGPHCKYAPVYGYLSADCSDRGFESIPLLRNGVEALDMSENKMKAVLNNTFLALTNLRYLYLNENRIKVVEAGALGVLRYLEVIDLSGNRLQTIPAGLMELPRLRKLYFADNLLGRLDPLFTFSSPTLQLLQLAECNLVDLPLGAMPELLHLNVSHNALSSLPLHDLAGMCRLQILDLGHMTETLFEELDMEEACQCQTFQRWAKLRGLDLGRSTRIVCRNDTNSADDPYAVTCNATQVAMVALEMHGRCERAEQQELRAQMRGWWVVAISVAGATVLVMAVVLCFCQRRGREPRHMKVPVVEPHEAPVSQSNGQANGSVRVRSGGGQSAPDGK